MSLKLAIVACLLALAQSRSLSMSPRIIGSRNAVPGEFPHQISLQWGWLPFFPYAHFCGGSILNETWIVTAAHCAKAMQQFPTGVTFLVRAGKQDLARIERTEQASLTGKTFIHQKYNDSAPVAPYDIALIKLRTPLIFTKRVAPIALPKQNSEPNGTVALSGWGAVNNSTRNPKYPTILQTVDMPIIDRETCEQAVDEVGQEEGEDLKGSVDETNICTGPLAGGTAACSGDSGGPLTFKNEEDKSELVGIVSWGMIPCGRKGAPSVYVKVSSFVDWIEDTISKN